MLQLKESERRQLGREVGVVWVDDVENPDYVRELVINWADTRQGPIHWDGAGRMIGYSVLAADTPNNGHPCCFTRRVFVLYSRDRDSDPNGLYETGAPCEAVDPRTVRPCHCGVITDRAWAGGSSNPCGDSR